MNLLNRIMSYDKTKNENQEQCNCAECIGNAEISKKKEIAWNFKYADDFLIKVENYRMMCREKEISNIMNLEYWYKDVKTKNFIWKSLHVHGNKYIYHKSVYIGYNEKLQIECRNGHSFPQSPHSHFAHHGCSKCSAKKRGKERTLTLEEFITRAKEIHGDEYDYSKVIYINYRTDIILICKNHEIPYEFPITPHDHLIGVGCPICYGKHKFTTEEFINISRKIHGDIYDYSKVNYIDYETEVIIICPEHDEFPQKPSIHLRGNGCPMCNESKGERKIRIFLTNNNIKFEREKRFDDCRYKRYLPFDFYLPQYNLCIEFDGKQHFIPHDFNSKESDEKKLENLKIVQLRDQIKNDYCKNNGIILIRLNNLKTVEKELIKYFQKYGIL